MNEKEMIKLKQQYENELKLELRKYVGQENSKYTRSCIEKEIIIFYSSKLIEYLQSIINKYDEFELKCNVEKYLYLFLENMVYYKVNLISNKKEYVLEITIDDIVIIFEIYRDIENE